MFRAPMPEAAIHENDNPYATEGEVRLSKQRLMPPPAGYVTLPEYLRKSQFGSLVAPSTNPRHDFRALRCGENISHISVLSGDAIHKFG